jgi:hypothetical protein
MKPASIAAKKLLSQCARSVFLFRRCQGLGDTDADIDDVFLVPLGVFFQQNLAGNGLIGKFGEQGFLHGVVL